MPALESDRLILRPPNPRDIEAMAVWLGDYDVARMTSRVPHPYGERDAAAFIAAAPALGFVIQRKADGLFLGMAGLRPEDGFEMGYWLGKPFWGHGYASEAARRLADHAFARLGRTHLQAAWFHDNPASGHVLAKLGGRPDGSRMRYSLARKAMVLAHEMVLTRADFLRKRAA